MNDGLVHTSDEEAGIRRRGHRRFRYLDEASGAVVRDASTLERIEGLVIPPAWTDVWICARPNGHLQATGRDARKRKQYRYHPRYRSRREAEKYADLVPFGEALGPLRARLREDVAASELDFDRIVGLVLVLLDTTHIRIGNEHYARANGTFGLTTLRDRHVREQRGVSHLCFVGKGGKLHDVEITDPALARHVRRCRQVPGQRLFQWIDVRGDRHPVTSTDVNERLRELTGLEVTAKTFRTWGASTRAARQLADAGEASTQREADRAVIEAIDGVAEHLGNTRAVARSSYIHPAVIAAYEEHRLAEWWRDGPTSAGHGLSGDERKLLAVLRRSRRAGLGVAARRRAA